MPLRLGDDHFAQQLELPLRDGGNCTAAGFSNGKLQVFDAKLSSIQTLNEAGSVDCIVLDDKTRVMVTSTANKVIHVYRMNQLSMKPVEILCPADITAIATDDEFIFVAGADRTVRRFPLSITWFENFLSTRLPGGFSREEWATHIGNDIPFNP